MEIINLEELRSALEKEKLKNQKLEENFVNERTSRLKIEQQYNELRKNHYEYMFQKDKSEESIVNRVSFPYFVLI